jgi:RNA polymerase primary sigma factor
VNGQREDAGMHEGKSFSKEQIENALEPLTEYERQILRQRLGLSEGRSRSREEVSKEFQVSPEFIHQLEGKLKNFL